MRLYVMRHAEAAPGGSTDDRAGHPAAGGVGEGQAPTALGIPRLPRRQSRFRSVEPRSGSADRLDSQRPLTDEGHRQARLAKKLGVAFSTVNRWLNRHMKPSQIQEYQIRKLVGTNERVVAR